MRTLLIGTAVVLLMTTSSPAFARYGYCSASIKNAPELANGLYPQRLSGVVDFGDRSASGDGYMAERIRTIRAEFAGIYGNRADCAIVYPSIWQAEEARQRYMSATEGKSEDTGWVGNYAPSGIEIPKMSGPFLRVEDNGVKARTEAWENHLLQVAREQAQREAKIVVLKAERIAEDKRTLEIVIAKYRKRGRSQ